MSKVIKPVWGHMKYQSKFWIVTTIVFGLLAVLGVFIAWNCSEDAISRTFEQYNHVQVFEDGSFIGELKDGTSVSGCLPDGLCNRR